jgi:hypothetical protein
MIIMTSFKKRFPSMADTYYYLIFRLHLEYYYILESWLLIRPIIVSSMADYCLLVLVIIIMNVMTTGPPNRRCYLQCPRKPWVSVRAAMNPGSWPRQPATWWRWEGPLPPPSFYVVSPAPQARTRCGWGTPTLTHTWQAKNNFFYIYINEINN